MESPRRKELTPDLEKTLKKARAYEWVTLVYLVSVVVLMYFVLGSSQAMKTAWFEDLLSIIPSISFLVAVRLYDKPATKKFPYGFHKVFDIAFLAGSLALFTMGFYLCITSVKALLMAEHPTIGSWYIFGKHIWLGWLMIAVLLYSSLPAMWIGRKKLPLAKKLHNKILYTDAEAQKADYVTAFAAIAGILGVGMGFWWADATAATIISLSVLKDGFQNLKESVQGLLGRRPQQVENEEMDMLLKQVLATANNWGWAQKAGVRFREHGQVYFGDILVIPNSENYSPDYTQAHEEVLDLHWKIQDVMIMQVDSIPGHYYTD